MSARASSTTTSCRSTCRAARSCSTAIPARPTPADALIVATGAEAKWLNLPSEQKFRGYGVSACATCDGFFYKNREVVVVGGGNTAVEEALFLTNFATKVTRRSPPRRISAPSRSCRTACSPTRRSRWSGTPRFEDVLGTSTIPPSVTGVRLRNVKTGAVSEIKADGVFVAIGHAPSIGTSRRPVEAEAVRLRLDGARFDRDQHSGRFRRRRRYRRDFPPGGDRRRPRLHGGAGGGKVPGDSGGAACPGVEAAE